MSNKKLVSVIMLTTEERMNNGMLNNAMRLFRNQDYPNKELIIVCDDKIMSIDFTERGIRIISTGPYKMTIGAKRHVGINHSSGDYIAHMDDDDFYSPQWLSKSIDFLETTGCSLTGLSEALMHDYSKDLTYLYSFLPQNAPIKKYVLGATMVYKKEAYYNYTRFKDLDSGEDYYLCADLGAYRLITPHRFIRDFVVTLHSKNTASNKNLQAAEFTKLQESQIIREYLGADNYKTYCNLAK
jgi:glycosyltransferase involved in cell wall biosynthesis